jgi:hypothetical protein
VPYFFSSNRRWLSECCSGGLSPSVAFDQTPRCLAGTTWQRLVTPRPRFWLFRYCQRFKYGRHREQESMVRSSTSVLNSRLRYRPIGLPIAFHPRPHRAHRAESALWAQERGHQRTRTKYTHKATNSVVGIALPRWAPGSWGRKRSKEKNKNTSWTSPGV